MERKSQDADGAYVYITEVSANRASSDYTARVIPHFQSAGVVAKVPLEANYILWQR
jgi:hypothetical protein